MTALQYEILREVDRRWSPVSEHLILKAIKNHPRAVVFGTIQGLVFERKLNRSVSGEGSGRTYYVALANAGREALASFVDEGETP